MKRKQRKMTNDNIVKTTAMAIENKDDLAGLTLTQATHQVAAHLEVPVDDVSESTVKGIFDKLGIQLSESQVTTKDWRKRLEALEQTVEGLEKTVKYLETALELATKKEGPSLFDQEGA